MEKKGKKNIEQGISNDEVIRTSGSLPKTCRDAGFGVTTRIARN